MADLNIDPRCVHVEAIKKGTSSQNKVLFNNLITLYANSNLRSSALQLFHSIPKPNTVTWTSIISAFSNSPIAVDLFISMLRHPRRTLPNARTFATLLKTCAALPNNSLSPQLQSLSFKLCLYNGPFVGSAFVSGYCKSGDWNSACKVFDEMPERDEVCFSAIINGLAQNKRPIDALRYFIEMRREIIPSSFHSVSGVLCATSRAAMLEQCTAIHSHSIVTGLNLDIYVATALVDAYGKCGLVEEAKSLFDSFEIESNVAMWNAMMSAYALQGSKENVVQLFNSMEKRGVGPDEYTFLAILTAFYNAGNATGTEFWLNKMKLEYKLNPWIEHYTCLIGAMGRSGRLEEAKNLALTMPYEPDSAVYRVLLSSCMNKENADSAWGLAEKLWEIDPNDDSAYVILSNVYANASMWDEVKKVWKMMRESGVRKEIGRSWIEVRGKVHVFFSGDKRHYRNDEIRAKVEELMIGIEKLGYVAVKEEILHEVGDEEEKRDFLWYHGEKMAVAFGLLSGVVPPGKAVRILKNLRMCRDCHHAFKYISVVSEREIIVRDVHRYHRFLNGSCSCGDSW